jgi:DNA helicase-4
MEVFLFILLIALIYLFLTRTDARKIEKIKSEPVFTDNHENISLFFEEISILKKGYFIHDEKEILLKKYASAYQYFKKIPYQKLNDKQIYEFLDAYSNMKSLIKEWNKQYVNEELVKYGSLFDDVDGKSLDAQQRMAVVVDEKNNLVLAGAGSGKTLTIAGKVKYLVEAKKFNPDEILLISFTTKSAEEMRQRIVEKLHINVEVRTFHGLGNRIIQHTHSNRYTVVENELLYNVVQAYFKDETYKNKKHIENLIKFFGYYINVPKDWEEFDSLGDCYDYYNSADFETLKSKIRSSEIEVEDLAEKLKKEKHTLHGETVKSLEEVIIANFLFLNGINYVYEDRYPYDTGDEYHKVYQPDFHLVDYSIYLEHFGITKDNRAPWLTEIEEKKYIDGIEWKRNLHKENKTKLIETYSYFNKEGILIIELEKKLKESKVALNPVDYSVIYKQIFNRNNRYLSEFIKLVSSFIKLFKSNGYSEDHFVNLYNQVDMQGNFFLKERGKLFLNIVNPAYQEYQKCLRESGKIDFDDMINLATESVRSGRGDFLYKYIIIDEYQDISKSRFDLIKAIKDRTNANLLCVGDDWQSIYRFAGSDIDLFTDFGKYVGYYELLKIEKTYRNSQELIDIAGKFIMRNRNQLAKDLKSDKHHSNPLRIIGYDKDIFTAIIKVIDEIVSGYGERAQITILGRNGFDKNIFDECKEFDVGKEKIVYKKYPHVNMKYITSHKAKGLEADNVIVINLENKLVGFPNKISDDPILSLVLTNQDSFEFAEERRLFYVAITRTKNTTYLLVPDKNKSVFAKELISDFGIQYEFKTGEKTTKDNPKCPKCKTGHLIIRENSVDHSVFLGCSNFPSCDWKKKYTEILNSQIKCNVCGGYMIKKNGKYGEFYWCTNYPYCENTLSIHRR